MMAYIVLIVGFIAVILIIIGTGNVIRRIRLWLIARVLHRFDLAWRRPPNVRCSVCGEVRNIPDDVLQGHADTGTWLDQHVCEPR